MAATSLDLSQIKTDALSSAATFRSLIELGSSDTPTFSSLTLKLSSGNHITLGTTAKGYIGQNSANTTMYFHAPNTYAIRLVTNTGIVEQYYSNVPQEYRLYNTQTDASNYERLTFKYNSTPGVTAYVIGQESDGTGTDRPIIISSDVNPINNAHIRLSKSGSSQIDINNASQGSRIAMGSNILAACGMLYNDTNGNLGRSDLRWGEIFLGGKTVTTSTPLFDATQTWNDAAVTFTAMKLDVTDTASASDSLLMDLQVGGTSKFKIDRGANAVFNGHNNYVKVGTNGGFYGSGTRLVLGPTTAGWVVKINAAQTGRDGSIGWSSTTDIAYTPDLRLYRDAAGTLAQRNGTNAQEYRLYNTYTDASNYERAFLKWDSNLLTLGTAGDGTGTDYRNIRINPGFNTYSTAYTEINAQGFQTWKTSGGGNIYAIMGYTGCQVQSPHSLIGFVAMRTANMFDIAWVIGRDASDDAACISGGTAGTSHELKIFNLGSSNLADQEFASLRWDSNVFSIKCEATGTGTVHNIVIENVAKINGSTSSSADPSTTEYPNTGDHGIHKNTTSGNVFLAYNDGGSIVKVQLT